MRRRALVLISVLTFGCAQAPDPLDPKDVGAALDGREATLDGGVAAPDATQLPDATTPDAATSPTRGVWLDLTPGGVLLSWRGVGDAAQLELTRLRAGAERNLGTRPVASGSTVDGDLNPGLRRYRFEFGGTWTATRAIVVPAPIAVSAPEVVGHAPYRSVVGDIDGDGWPEPFGAANMQGRLQVVSDADRGLGGLFTPGGCCRHAHLVDVDLDGALDLVSNDYASLGTPGTETLLYRNVGGGVFAEDAAFRALGIGGFGETMLSFDMDNDGDLELFLPFYSHESLDEQCYLLENDGLGGFVDIADGAGVALRDVPYELRVEGAQAADVNDDGFIDLYVGSALFLNRGDKTFVDARVQAGLPARFDEGVRFIDHDADGRLDLLVHHPNRGPALFVQTGSTSLSGEQVVVPTFERRALFPPNLRFEDSFGMNAGDLDHDGREEIFLASSMSDDTAVTLRFDGARYRVVDNDRLAGRGRIYSAPAFADFDRDGRLDMVRQAELDQMLAFSNRTVTASTAGFVIRVLGERGARNQQGRVVRARPISHPGWVLTRVVDGGAGYLSQSDYDLLIGTPYPEPHRVEVRFADGVVNFMVSPGARVSINARGEVRPLAGWP